MPKGTTSRPDNRKTKKAVVRQKQRKTAAKKALKSGVSSKVVRGMITKTKGAEADTKTIAGSRIKADDRSISSKVGKKHLGQTDLQTKRQRVKKKKK